MIQTKKKENCKEATRGNNSVNHLHFFGIRYPFVEIDGMKIASDELEYAIRNHPCSPESHEFIKYILS